MGVGDLIGTGVRSKVARVLLCSLAEPSQKKARQRQKEERNVAGTTPPPVAAAFGATIPLRATWMQNSSASASAWAKLNGRRRAWSVGSRS